MTKDECLLYELQTLAAYEPDDLDNPEIEVSYETKSGCESWLTVCVVDLARRLEKYLSDHEQAMAAILEENNLLKGQVVEKDARIARLMKAQ